MAKPSSRVDPAKSQKQSQPIDPAQSSASEKQLLQALRDDVSPEASPALQFVLDNAKAIATVVVVGIVIAVAIIVYKWNYKKEVEKYKADVAAVMISQEGNNRIEALEKLLPEVPDELLDGVYLEIVSVAEEIKAHAKAAEFWGKIYNHTKDSSLKAVAGIGEAKELAAENKTAEAVQLLENLTQSADALLVPQVQMELALLAESAGDLQKSRAAYEALLLNSGEFDKTFIASQIEILNQKINQK